MWLVLFAFPTHSLSLILFFFFYKSQIISFMIAMDVVDSVNKSSMAQSVILILALCMTITNVAFKNTHLKKIDTCICINESLCCIHETDTLFNYNIKTNKQKTEQERMPWKWEILKKIKICFLLSFHDSNVTGLKWGLGISIKKTSHLVRKPLSGNPVLCQIFAFLGFLISVVGHVI